MLFGMDLYSLLITIGIWIILAISTYVHMQVVTYSLQTLQTLRRNDKYKPVRSYVLITMVCFIPVLNVLMLIKLFDARKDMIL